jgi:hypothetical protein
LDELFDDEFDELLDELFEDEFELLLDELFEDEFDEVFEDEFELWATTKRPSSPARSIATGAFVSTAGAAEAMPAMAVRAAPAASVVMVTFFMMISSSLVDVAPL